MTKKQKYNLKRIIAAAVMMVVLHFLPLEGRVRFLAYMVPYLTVGYDILKKAWKGILNKQVFDENFLMAVATIGAIVLGAFWTGDYVEAVAVMLFYQVGELFQSIAIGKSRKNISELMDIRPDYANIEEGGELKKADPAEVAVGSIIIVQPGEKVPLDGIVIEGDTALDASALTGESLPRSVKAGDDIVSGCINLSGVIKVKTTKEFGESTVSKILDLVENASSRKSKSEDFISKFARYYTPAVCCFALALALIPPIVRIIMKTEPLWGTWVYRALIFLVISCPCALVISIPLSFFAGIGGASKAGVLVKGSNFLEGLSKLGVLVVDKTGTLTKGNFAVSGIHHSVLENAQLLEYAAMAESSSSHPISKSLQAAYGKEIDRSRIGDIKENSGEGVTTEVDGKVIAVGNEKLMKRLGAEFRPCHHTGTVIHVAIDGEYAGHILIADEIKENSKDALSELKKLGVEKSVMLTGDNEKVAEAVSKELGIDEFHANLLPEDKVEKVESLLQDMKEGKMLAFAGDGINDAPVLSRADIGIAMGALGSDAAIEAADVVLMDDDPMQIPRAVRIAKKCMKIVYENIFFAIGVKVICLVLAALGFANMWLAIFADVGVMVIAVLNAIRALRVKDMQKES